MNCPHGLYLGFFIMKNAESPETVFSLMFGRFNDAKKIIIYLDYHQYLLPVAFSTSSTSMSFVSSRC